MARVYTAEQKKAKAKANAERYKRNKEEILGQQRDYYKENKDVIREKHRKYMTTYNKKTSTKDRRSEWAWRNPDAIRQHAATYKKKHPQRVTKTQQKTDMPMQKNIK